MESITLKTPADGTNRRRKLALTPDGVSCERDPRHSQQHYLFPPMGQFPGACWTRDSAGKNPQKPMPEFLGLSGLTAEFWLAFLDLTPGEFYLFSVEGVSLAQAPCADDGIAPFQ
jgi:hypothetical protein